MKVLTQEALQEIVARVNTANELAEALQEEGFVREAPKLSMNKRQIVEVLQQSDRVRTETNSPYILKRLVELGYLKREKDDKAVNIGRRPYLYMLDRRGTALLNLSKNWKPKKEAVEETVAAE